MPLPFIADAHLDLAYNALRGRDATRPAVEQRPDHEGVPSVGLPDLRAGGVRLICATIFCEPDLKNTGQGYRTADQAHDIARAQLGWYQARFSAGELTLVTRRDQLPEPAIDGGRIHTIILMEGADPLRTEEDVASFYQAGLRVVGLAWKRTRHAGGTGEPGPLTDEGRRLVAALDARGVIHDTSHLAEESFWELLDLTAGPVIASHSNCRAIIPTDRHLTDPMIKALAARDGVIGVNFYDRFLLPPGEYGQRRANLADVVRHVRHMCDLIGDAEHVALGTDMDGGFGRDQIPVEITTSADLPRVADALSAAGFPDPAVRGVLGENWLTLFRRSLPA